MTQDINNRAKPGYRVQAAEELLVRKNHQTSKEKVHPPNRTNVNRQAKDSKNKKKQVWGRVSVHTPTLPNPAVLSMSGLTVCCGFLERLKPLKNPGRKDPPSKPPLRTSVVGVSAVSGSAGRASSSVSESSLSSNGGGGAVVIRRSDE